MPLDDDTKILIDEIDNMDKAMSGFDNPIEEPDPEPEVDPKPDPEPEIDPIPEPEPEPDLEVKDEITDPDPDPDPDPEPEPTPDPDKITLLENEIAELKKKLEPPKVEPEPEPDPAPVKDPEIQIEDFVGENDLDDLTRDPEKFNSILNNIYKRAIEAARKEMKDQNESVIKSIPDITKSTLAVYSMLEKARNDFYAENKDLKAFPKVVSAVFEEKMAENPDKPYNEVLKLVGPEVRVRLDLHKKATTKDEEDPPPLPRKKGGRPPIPKPNTNPLLDELDAMDRVLNS